MIIDIFGVPCDLGANMRGANMGPAAIRIAGLHEAITRLGQKPVDHGDLHVDVREQMPQEHAKNEYLQGIVSICKGLKAIVQKSQEQKHFSLVLGGDHSVAIGSIAGVLKTAHASGKSVGLVWVDAHADMNTPQSSQTQNIHGMPLACALGDGHKELCELFAQFVKPEHVVLIGLRDIDGPEKERIKASGIRFFTMREIDERGVFAIIKDSLASLSVDQIHISFDLDGVDPLYAPGVSTAVTGGLSYREAHLLLEMLADDGRVRSADFVELNPVMDSQHKTARLCVELVQSLLGKSIV